MYWHFMGLFFRKQFMESVKTREILAQEFTMPILIFHEQYFRQLCFFYSTY